MRLKWTEVIVAALISGLLVACGGGGGGDGAKPTDEDHGAGIRLSAIRLYGDQWQMSVTQSLQGGSATREFVRDYRVEAVKPNGSYSLSIRTPAIDDATPDAVATDQYDANNNRSTAGQCVFAPGAPPRTTLVKGEEWTSNGVVSCVNDDVVQTTWTVKDDLTVVKAGISLHVYQLHRVSLTRSVNGGNVLQDPSQPVKTEATCLWAPDIGMYISCQSIHTYAQAPAAGALLSEDFDLKAFTPSPASAMPPAPPSLNYPAVRASVPQVGPAAPMTQAEVLGAPRLVPVYYANPQRQSEKTAFLHRLVVSQSWPVLQEYGVAAGQVMGDVILQNVFAPDTLQDSDIRAELAKQINGGAIKADPNNFLVVFIPSSTTVKTSGSSTSCVNFDAYHSYFKMPSGARIAYAVVPDCQRGNGSLTVAISHEVLEGVVDPYQTGYRAVQGDASWTAALDGAEIGDMCEHSVDVSAREETLVSGVSYPDYIARIWSNAAAIAGHNPCVPKRTPIQGDVYFNSVPQLDDVVQLVHGGDSLGIAKGVVIAPGMRKSISVRLFSDGPTYGQWNVHATWLKRKVDDPSDALSFQWDRTSGQNGDVLTLTITAPKTPQPNGALFTIESRYAGMTTVWTGVVANEAATATATVIAGSATQGKAVDGLGTAGRLTMAADGNSLMVANLNVLRKASLDGKVVTLPGNDLLNNPQALTTAAGAIYVAGERGVVPPSGSSATAWNRYLQRIDSQGVPTALKGVSGSGTVSGGKASSGGVAMGPDGHLYVAAPTLNQILVVDPRTGASAVYAGRSDGVAGADEGDVSIASFNHPMGLSFDTQGNLYVCDQGNHKIRRITAEGMVSTLAGSGASRNTSGQGAGASFAIDPMPLASQGGKMAPLS